MTYQNITNKIHFDTNVGGIKNIYWIPIEMAENIPLTGIVNAVDIYPSEIRADQWKTAEFIRETAKLTEEGAIGPNGPYVKVKLTFKLAKHYDNRVPNFEQMRETEYCVVIEDTNGLIRVIGEINLRGEKKGATFHEENTTSDIYATRNEYSCYFYSEQSRKIRAGSIPGGTLF